MNYYDNYEIIEEVNKLVKSLVKDHDNVKEKHLGPIERNLLRGIIIYSIELEPIDIESTLENVATTHKINLGWPLRDIETYNEGIEEENKNSKKKLQPLPITAAQYLDAYNSHPDEKTRKIAANELKDIVLQSNSLKEIQDFIEKKRTHN